MGATGGETRDGYVRIDRDREKNVMMTGGEETTNCRNVKTNDAAVEANQMMRMLVVVQRMQKIVVFPKKENLAVFQERRELVVYLKTKKHLRYWTEKKEGKSIR